MNCIQILVFILFLIPLVSVSQIPVKKIWIDTDNRMGKIKGDVDDGSALMLALAHSNMYLQGISTVHRIHYARKVTLILLKWYGGGKEIPVYNGAKGVQQ